MVLRVRGVRAGDRKGGNTIARGLVAGAIETSPMRSPHRAAWMTPIWTSDSRGRSHCGSYEHRRVRSLRCCDAMRAFDRIVLATLVALSFAEPIRREHDAV